jgi:hypothetical protein
MNTWEGLAHRSGNKFQLCQTVITGCVILSITAIFASNTETTEEKEQLIGISTKYGLRNCFKNLRVFSFWLAIRSLFPMLAGKKLLRIDYRFQQHISTRKHFTLTFIGKPNTEIDWTRNMTWDFMFLQSYLTLISVPVKTSTSITLKFYNVFTK